MHTSCVDVHSGQLPGGTPPRLKVWTRLADRPIVPLCHEANATLLKVVTATLLKVVTLKVPTLKAAQR